MYNVYKVHIATGKRWFIGCVNDYNHVRRVRKYKGYAGCKIVAEKV